MDTQQIVTALGEAWEKNDVTNFAQLFDEDGRIIHPYFKEPVMPQVALEVMNAAVRGRTILRQVEVISGTGSGADDSARLVFEESGDEIGRTPGHVAHIVATVEIRDKRIHSLTIHGFEVKPNPAEAGRTRYHRRDIGTPNTRRIAEMLGQCWGSNDMDTFVSLFADGAMIRHAVLNEEQTPEVVADLMNSNVKGTTALRSCAVLHGDGSGEEDVVELQFDETGSEIGYVPRLFGTMGITARIKNHRIASMRVHGYHVGEQGAEA
ncbi:MAG: hypothetical protein U1A78_00260 [Polyangia bacterium]